MRKTNQSARVVAVILLALTIAAVTVPPTMAQTSRSYDVRHNFVITPPGGSVAVLSIGNWRDFEHAWARTTPTPPQNAVVNPAVQPGNFAMYGGDWQNAWGQVWNSGGVQANLNITPFVVFPPGFTWTSPVNTADSLNQGGNRGIGNSQASVSMAIPGGPITGWTRAWGSAITGAPGSAYAFSSSNVAVRGLYFDWRRFRFRWTPVVTDYSSGSAAANRPRDPFIIRALDSGGATLLEDAPIIIKAWVDEGTDSYVEWKDGRLKLSATVGGFEAIVSSQYVPDGQEGSAELLVEDGLVTTSNDSGIFEGLLPLVGSSGTFDVAFPEYVEIDLEYPDVLAEVQDLEIELGGGSDLPRIPTVTEWGLIILTLLLLTGGTILFAKRRRPVTA